MNFESFSHFSSSSEKRYIWFNGEVIDSDKCFVPALSSTAQFGINVFETIRAYVNNDTSKLNLFRYRDHYKRLCDSARLIGFKIDFTSEYVLEAIKKIIDKNNYWTYDISLRIVLLLDEVGSWSSIGDPSLMIAPIIKSRLNIDSLPNLSANISSWQRINDMCMPPRVKAGPNYLNGRYAMLDSINKGFDLPILLGADLKISECPGSCICMVKDNKIITPSTTSSILESITLETISEIAKLNKIKFEVRSIDRTEILLADEIFTCGTSSEITPITKIDQFIVSDGKPGVITKFLLKKYHECLTGILPDSPFHLIPLNK